MSERNTRGNSLPTKVDTGREGQLEHWRNNLAARFANWALRRIATPHYRDFIGGAIVYGLNSAARDAREGRAEPDDWRIEAARSRGTGEK